MQTKWRTWHTVTMFCVSALLIIWLGNFTNIDILLADAAFDRANGTFPWNHSWIAETFGHVIMKRIFIGLGVGAAATGIYSFFSKWNSWQKFQWRFVGLAAVLVPTVVSIIKQMSASHCPWDLQRYGGDQPYVRLLESFPHAVTLGKCMPAGHASSALWLISLTIFFLPSRPKFAVIVAFFLLLVGFAIGWLQQLRGAHFLTHTLWSVWVSCVVMYVIYRALKCQTR